MDLHGGSISVESFGEGEGSTFTVTLPLFEGGTSEIEDDDLQSPESHIDLFGEADNPPTSSTFTSKESSNGLLQSGTSQKILLLSPPPLPPESIRSILVVDDSAINRKMLCRLFASKGIPCDQANDGCIAVDLVQQGISNDASTTSNNWMLSTEVGPDSVIVGHSQYDVILMDYQMPNMDGPTAIRIIRSMGYKGVIIGVTGNVMAMDQQEMIAAGADDVLSKPFDIDKFWESYSRARKLSEV